MAVPDCLQGSACFLVGVILILVKWALVGICVETYGFWLLFSGFFPVVLGFLRRLPVLGRLLDLPVLKTVRSLHIRTCHAGNALPLYVFTAMAPHSQVALASFFPLANAYADNSRFMFAFHGQPTGQYTKSLVTARCKQLFAFREQDSAAPQLTDVQVLNRIAPPQASGLPV